MQGLYDNADTGLQIRITEREGELYREIEGRDPVKLLHEEGNVFQYETNLDLRMSFDVDAEGQRGLTIYYASQEPQVLLRKQSAPDNPDYRAELVGEFVNTETNARMVLELDDDQNLSMTAFGRTFPVALNIRDVLEGRGYRIIAVRDENGKVQEFRLNGNRLRNVRFERADR